ncbi:MAG TPA: carbonic anhydrase [Acidisarcina sp.]|nr:carbonic anhydrase [Acidisarcina sp.]
MKRLLEGYRQFRRDAFPEKREHFHLLSEGQSPDTLFITCADSRIVPDLILQTEPGDLFICRNVGNVVPPNGEMAGGVSATIEYAVQVLKVRHIIICGHSDCGAIKAALDKQSVAALPAASQWLHYVESAWNFLDEVGSEGQGTKTEPGVVALIHANVIAQMQNLKSHPEVAGALAEGRLQVHGWFYDILSGTIEFYDPGLKKFVPLGW